jgi:hypothetical protein
VRLRHRIEIDLTVNGVDDDDWQPASIWRVCLCEELERTGKHLVWGHGVYSACTGAAQRRSDPRLPFFGPIRPDGHCVETIEDLS